MSFDRYSGVFTGLQWLEALQETSDFTSEKKISWKPINGCATIVLMEKRRNSKIICNNLRFRNISDPKLLIQNFWAINKLDSYSLIAPLSPFNSLPSDVCSHRLISSLQEPLIGPYVTWSSELSISSDVKEHGNRKVQKANALKLRKFEILQKPEKIWFELVGGSESWQAELSKPLPSQSLRERLLKKSF